MKRKDKILATALTMFNQQGIEATSLKTIAKALDISYGNVTYHFPNKNALVNQLYQNMLVAHHAILSTFQQSDNLLQDIILAPLKTFAISLEYRFLFIDIVTLKRKYAAIIEQQAAGNQAQMQQLLPLFEQLKKAGLLRQETSKEQIQFLMNASNAIRAFFFINLGEIELLNNQELQQQYLKQVNQLLWPYLTPQGIEIYNQLLLD